MFPRVTSVSGVVLLPEVEEDEENDFLERIGDVFLSAVFKLGSSYMSLEGRSIQKTDWLRIIGRDFFGIDNSLEEDQEVITTLDRWIAEKENEEKSTRIGVKKRVVSFLYDETQTELNFTGLSIPGSTNGHSRLSELPDIWEHPAFSKRLKVLDLSFNHLQYIPESIGSLRALQKLALDANKLSTLPMSIGNLKALEILCISSNKMEHFPECIKMLTNLQQLYFGSMQIVEIPPFIGDLTSLKTIAASESLLTTLPSTIQNLVNLTTLRADRNRLRTIPTSIGKLKQIEYLYLGRNPTLTSLPNEFLQLPSSCYVDLSGCGLSTQVLSRLRDTSHTFGYRGPRINYSMEYIEGREIDTRTVDELLDELYQIAGKIKPLFSQEFTSNLELKDWLSRLSYMADFKANQGEKRVVVANKVLEFLELAANPAHPEFHDIFFGMVGNATRSCGDSMSLSLLHLGIAKRLALLEPGDLKGLATLLLKGTWALSQLEEFARNKVRVLRFFDEIEVYLAYPIKLKEGLGLPIDVDEMLYFQCSGLTEEDLRIAEESVRSNLQNKESVYAFLSSQELWMDALDKLRVLNELKRTRTEQAEGVKTVNELQGIEEEYQSGVRALTAKMLAECGFVFEEEKSSF